MLKNHPSHQLQEKFHVINGFQKQGRNEFVLAGCKKGTEENGKGTPLLSGLRRDRTTTNLQTLRKIPPSQKPPPKRAGGKRGRNMPLKYFHQGKNGHHTSHRSSQKTSCTSPGGAAPRGSRTRPGPAATARRRQRDLDSAKGSTPWPPGSPTQPIIKEVGGKEEKKTKNKKRTKKKKKKNRTRMPLRRYSPSGSKMLE